MATAAPPSDQETAPLLRDPDAEEARNQNSHPSLTERIGSMAQEPLTPLTKVLLVLALVLLLLTSVFIGLFAGAQHRLRVEKGRNGGGGGDKSPGSPITVTATATYTATSVETTVATTTATATATVTATSVSATTTVATSTVVRSTTVVPRPGPTSPPTESPCLTPHCIKLSASILSSLDTSQDPCENFYDFANGGWLNSHPLPADKASFGNFEALAQENKQIIQKILESGPSHSTLLSSQDKEILSKLQNLYSSCLNQDRLDEIGTIPLKHLVQTLRKLYRGEDTDISLSEEAKKSEGLTAALAFLHSRGIDALFSFEIEGDVGVDPNFMVLWFNQPDLGLPSKEYYEEKSIMKIYQDVVERLLSILSEDQNDPDVISPDINQSEGVQLPLASDKDAPVWPPWPWPPWDGDGNDDGGEKKPPGRSRGAHKLAKEVLKFERKLADASLDLDILLQDPLATYNPVPLSNLTDTLPQIYFPTYFSTFTPRRLPQHVVMTYPKYATSLAEILDDTPSDVIEAYLVTRAALDTASHLGMGSEAWQAQRVLYEALAGLKKGAVGDRAEYCVGKVEQAMGFAAGRYFVNQTFAGDSKEKGTKVITDIVSSFKNSLAKIDWMDKQSAQAASEKADAIRVKVGFPLSPDTRDPQSIARYYSNVKIDQVNFYENMLSASSSDVFKKWLQLGQRRNPQTWEMYPSMVNAYFNPPANEIVFPAGILRPPFFAQEWPAYLSYGSFGHVAAHELTHAFDSAGRLYNQNGKLEQWWTNSPAGVSRSNKTVLLNNILGLIYCRTSGENIGDTGLIQAYRAWKSQFASSFQAGNEYILPGLNYTREQLFFISFARVWARSMKPAAAVQRIRTDPHSPSRFRVDGTVSNIPEFAQAFKCSKDAKILVNLVRNDTYI
ncbi:hypothetical protein BD779DRAFT_1467099 [Infundibulicybe gibba]|nr:hypothetical protein BD779DRAFT_1467099 [Infundibulicybe gibba]